MVMAATPRVSCSESSPVRKGTLKRKLAAVATALALVISLAAPGSAADVRITATGTITTTDPGMGYSPGDPVTLSWLVNDFAPATPTGSVTAGDDYRWVQETDTEPLLFADVSGTGIGGTYTGAPGSAPYDQIRVGPVADGEFRVYMATDGDGSLHHGIYLLADPTYFIRAVEFGGEINAIFSSPADPLPNPATYLANYAGTYSVSSQLAGRVRAAKPGSPDLNANFTTTSVTIAQVPEPASVALAAIGIAGAGIAFRRRQLARRSS